MNFYVKETKKTLVLKNLKKSLRANLPKGLRKDTLSIELDLLQNDNNNMNNY